MALEITPGLLERGVAIEERLERPLLFHDSPRLMSAVQLRCRMNLIVPPRCSRRSSATR